MGALRLLLAAAVMLEHYSFFPERYPFMIPGGYAVEAFYIISGFLITLVLTERYKDHFFLFYSNRALRLYPIYWTCLALYVIADVAVTKGWLQGGLEYWSVIKTAHQHPLSPLGIAVMAFVNIAIVGQDIVRGLGEPNANLFYHSFVYIKVAWSVAVEIGFYVVAPFIVPRLRLSIALLVLSLGAQCALTLLPPHNPMDWEFFPFDLWCFLAGGLAYRVYAIIRSQKTPLVSSYTAFAPVLAFALTATFNTIEPPRLLYLFAIAACLPGVVLAGRLNPLDRILGDLSYPLYLVHPLLFLLIPPGIKEWMAIAAAIVVSFGLVYLVERPIDAYRKRRVRDAATPMRHTRPQFSPTWRSASAPANEPSLPAP